MKIIDLFAGVGGMSQGFIAAGFEVVVAIEHDREIAHSFKLNHKDTIVYDSDIQTIDPLELKILHGDVDVVIGGPPCQGFSQKGKRMSIDDDRNYLFKYFIKFVEVFNPTYFLLENVPNITTTSDGFFKEEILKAFGNMGYHIDCKVLNAVNFGVPQERKRAFFLGSKIEKIDLPLGNDTRTTIQDAIYDLPFIKSGEGALITDYQLKPLSMYQKKLREGSDKIYNHQSTKHSAIALERLAMIPKGKGREVLPQEHRTKSIYSGTWTRLKEDGFAATITTRFDTPSSGLFTHPILDRCLTVREAARIQSFSDKFIFYGSKFSQMKQVGNAVPPLLAFEIAKLIQLNYLKNSKIPKYESLP